MWSPLFLNEIVTFVPNVFGSALLVTLRVRGIEGCDKLAQCSAKGINEVLLLFYGGRLTSYKR